MHDRYHHKNTPNVSEWERWVSALAAGIILNNAAKRGGVDGFGLAVLGLGLLKRAATGSCSVYRALGVNTAESGDQYAPGIRHEQGIKVRHAISIDKSPQELYDFFRNFDNLPKFMQHLESVSPRAGDRTHWVARAPFGRFVEWDAEIINDKPGELIAWRSLPGADVDNAGSVSFRRGPEGRGTEVHVALSYQPPFGRLGAVLAKLLGEEPSQQIEADMRHFKQLMETGEIPTIEGQPSGRGPDEDPAK
jgi:uncharacterized membrane protein